MTRPNLFLFATSELSQDAFICWLLAWADPKYQIENRLLHEIGTKFLHALFERGGYQCPTPTQSVEVKKQCGNIDVLAIVNGQTPLLIEDKTHTKNHSGQLERYRETVSQKYGTSNFPAIYLKTGDQSNYTEIERAGYGVFLRNDFLDLLKEAIEREVSDHILIDFYEYLFERETSIQAFKTIPVSEWNPNCWTGFFIELQKQLNDGHWDYVPNAGGGFMGFWWHWDENKYLQLEEEKLCFKLQVHEKENQSAHRNRWYKRLRAASANTAFPIRKPARFGTGTWMTAAILQEDYLMCDEGDCWT